MPEKEQEHSSQVHRDYQQSGNRYCLLSSRNIPFINSKKRIQLCMIRWMRSIHMLLSWWTLSLFTVNFQVEWMQNYVSNKSKSDITAEDMWFVYYALCWILTDPGVQDWTWVTLVLCSFHAKYLFLSKQILWILKTIKLYEPC